MATLRLFLHPDGTVAPVSEDRADSEVLNAALSVGDGEAGAASSVETVCQFPRSGRFALLRQEQSLQGWGGTTHRSLDCRRSPPRLRVASSGGEAPRDTVLARWPVYTEEMLFTYLRALPLRAGYREEVWLHDWGREGKLAPSPRFATITVRAEAPGVRDMDTWYVTVDRDGGRRSEFWIGAGGLHPVVVANLADGSIWTLQKVTHQENGSW